LDVPALLLSVNDFFLPFRMPTLMFLSGLLLPRSLSKPLRTFYWGKIRLVAWPWLLWTAVYQVVNGHAWLLAHPRSYVAQGYMWFLFFLCVYYFVAPALRRLPSLLPPAALLVISFLVQPADSLVHRLLYFGVFFFAGAWVARDGTRLLARLNRPVLLIALAVAAVGLGIASALTEITYVSVFVPLSLAGIVVAVGVAGRLSDRSTRWVRFVGRHSIVYYVAHYPVMVGALWVVQELGGNGLVAVVVLMAAGLAVTTALAWWRDSRPVSWMFELPTVRRGARAASR
jgi:peptidoglycan/LPS O-acetylase OafA/YrhL